jgi:hypothetical protein
VSVVNASSATTSFSAYAVCFTPPDGGAADLSTFQVAPHSLDTRTSPACLTPGSGGPQIGGKSTQVVLHSSRPTLAGGWVTSVANDTAATRTYELEDICQNLAPGVHVIAGAPVSNPPLTQTHATVMCDTGVPLAGGVGASSGSTLVSVNSSSPIDGGWQAYENNSDLTRDTIRAWVLCS